MFEDRLTVTTQSSNELPVLLKAPSGEGQFPTVVLVQGFGMDMHEYRNSHDEISDGLVAFGIATVQFDFSYQKESTQSGGPELSLHERREELNEILHWAAKKSQVDPQRIGLLGNSMGVYTILSNKLHLGKSLCFVSGLGYDFEKSVARFESHGAIINFQGETRLPRSTGKVTIVQPDFWASLEGHHQIELVKKLYKPVLVIQGDDDPILSEEKAEVVFDAIDSEKKRWHLFAGGDHGIINVPGPMRDEFLKLIVDWFKETL